MKDKLTTTLIIFCVLVGGVLIFLILLGLTAKPTPPSPVPATPPTSTPIPVTPTAQNKIPIGPIEVNNFLANPLEANQSGDAVIVDNDRYRIVYLAITQEFLVRVLAQPFEPIRQEAENAFLEKLGVTKQQACQLKVTVFPPINKEQVEDSYRLSFCQ